MLRTYVFAVFLLYSLFESATNTRVWFSVVFYDGYLMNKFY